MCAPPSWVCKIVPCTHMHTGPNNHSSIDFIVRISLRTKHPDSRRSKTSCHHSIPVGNQGPAPLYKRVAQAGQGHRGASKRLSPQS